MDQKSIKKKLSVFHQETVTRPVSNGLNIESRVLCGKWRVVKKTFSKSECCTRHRRLGIGAFIVQNEFPVCKGNIHVFVCELTFCNIWPFITLNFSRILRPSATVTSSGKSTMLMWRTCTISQVDNVGNLCGKKETLIKNFKVYGVQITFHGTNPIGLELHKRGKYFFYREMHWSWWPYHRPIFLRISGGPSSRILGSWPLRAFMIGCQIT